MLSFEDDKISSFEDDEIENYKAKYGTIEINDNHFDDHQYLGFEFLEYKISKIKIWTAKKGQYTALGGIQTTYVNCRDGTEYISNEFKGEKVGKDDLIEFNLQKNEYIIYSILWFEEGAINKIIFKTNLKNTFSVGDAKGEEMKVDEFDKCKFLLSFFGTYGSNYLTSIGMFITNKNQYFDYFVKGYFELNLFINKDKNKKEIEEKIQKQEYKENDIILLRACRLPRNIFHEIIKYIDPLLKPL